MSSLSHRAKPLLDIRRACAGSRHQQRGKAHCSVHSRSCTRTAPERLRLAQLLAVNHTTLSAEASCSDATSDNLTPVAPSELGGNADCQASVSCVYSPAAGANFDERSWSGGSTGRKLPSSSRVNVPELRTGVDSGLSPSRGQPRKLRKSSDRRLCAGPLARDA